MLHGDAAFLCEFHRRYDEAVGVRHEGPRPPCVLAAGDHVQQVHAAGHMRRVGKRRAHMLGRAGTAGIKRVDVHLVIVGDVAAHHDALEEVDVVEMLRQPRRVVEILRGGIAVFARLHVDDMHRRARRAVMHPRAREEKVVFFFAPVQRDVARRDGQHVLHQRAGEADAPVVAEDRAGTGQDLDARFRRVGKPDGFKRLQRRFVDAQYGLVGQRPVLPAGQPGAYRSQVLRKRRGAGCDAARPPAGTPRRPCVLDHFSHSRCLRRPR